MFFRNSIIVLYIITTELSLMNIIIVYNLSFIALSLYL